MKLLIVRDLFIVTDRRILNVERAHQASPGLIVSGVDGRYGQSFFCVAALHLGHATGAAFVLTITTCSGSIINF